MVWPVRFWETMFNLAWIQWHTFGSISLCQCGEVCLKSSGHICFSCVHRNKWLVGKQSCQVYLLECFFQPLFFNFFPTTSVQSFSVFPILTSSISEACWATEVAKSKLKTFFRSFYSDIIDGSTHGYVIFQPAVPLHGHLYFQSISRTFFQKGSTQKNNPVSS